MKRKLFLIVALMMVLVLALAACGGGDDKSEGGATARPTPPAEYASKTNPLGADAATAGQGIYTTNCASCHGDTGKGDVPAGTSLNPHPGNLVNAAKEANDAYLFWRISEGGQMAPFNSAMPAWKGVLTEEQIWQVVSYIKTLK